MPVDIKTLLGNPRTGFTPIEDVARFEGDPNYVEGALCMDIDGIPLITAEYWDDVNWLWPFVVEASQACEETGHGETLFPDQGIEFRLDRLGDSGRVRASLTSSNDSRAAVMMASEFYPALAHAGLHFFGHLERLVPAAADVDGEQIAALRRWQQR